MSEPDRPDLHDLRHDRSDVDPDGVPDDDALGEDAVDEPARAERADAAPVSS